MRDLLRNEYFSWNNGHSQFLSYSVREVVATVRIVLKMIDLGVRLRIAHAMDAEMVLQVEVLNGGIRVMVRLVVKLVLEGYVWLSPEIFSLIADALGLVEYGDYLLNFGLVYLIMLLFLMDHSLQAISQGLQCYLI